MTLLALLRHVAAQSALRDERPEAAHGRVEEVRQDGRVRVLMDDGRSVLCTQAGDEPLMASRGVWVHAAAGEEGVILGASGR